MTFRTVERDEDDTAVVPYTSGTTGHPKRRAASPQRV
ncbi:MULTISPECIES: AMP-binding protein [Streptomyces]|nr:MULTISPECIES: AMP-binding protein [Streptomyces]